MVAALIATGVVEAFDGTDLTVFAPNDNAFYMLTGTDNDTDASGNDCHARRQYDQF